MGISVAEFVRKWQRVELTERSASQQHFLDLCELLDHLKPAEADPVGEWFTFERGASKHGGGDGWADVWKRGFFGWEYKGKHKDLDAAYDQLLKYREALENPPLLVVCDMDRFIIRTNFTNTPTQVYEFSLDDLAEPRNLEILRSVFHDFEKLRPGATSEAITEEAASRVAGIAQKLRERGFEAEQVARFLDRVVFCLFAEDIDLLPSMVFTKVLERSRRDPNRFVSLTSQLFEAMAQGGDFGVESIRYFNGHLFKDVDVLELTDQELEALCEAAALDWSAVDPSVLGTLFERGLDPSKRSQLGAHYTSREDIEMLVEPVVLAPLRREWQETRTLCENLFLTGKKFPKGNEKPPAKAQRTKGYNEAKMLIRTFLHRIAGVKVLDPACGSGNFLYVTLQKLKDLEKDVIIWATNHNIPGFFPQVGPWQLYGIEINRYAFELAQMAVWIGFLQWTRTNGFPLTDRPVLRPMDTFECRDAILDLSDSENPCEPQWPSVDFIVGNPPFLGVKFLRRELGDGYVEQLFKLYRNRIPNSSDLCCYWFEKARAHVETSHCHQAGLLATQGIRGRANRRVLERIKETGDIFFAVSDRPWVLDGANVHVSMVAFDNGAEESRVLDSETVISIHANLTSGADTTKARALRANSGLAYYSDVKAGAFDLTHEEAQKYLLAPNANGRPTSDVLVPWINGSDVLRRWRSQWIVDFGEKPIELAAGYDSVFGIVKTQVQPQRSTVKRKRYKELWWLHAEPCMVMRAAVAALSRYVVTAQTSKHRVFQWFSWPVLPDHTVIAFASEEDYMFGILHSTHHEIWALRLGTRLETRPRYTPSTCFETFPLPEPSEGQREEIAEAARELCRLRSNWLNPPEWTREESLAFPGSVNGPWSRFVHDPNERGIGTVRYPRTVPCDDECAKRLKTRTLTNLYNQRPTWIDLAHRRLDEAVFAAYGWPSDISDAEILERLLALNLACAT